MDAQSVDPRPDMDWLGWGGRIKVLEIGKIIQLGAEGIKLSKGTGKTVTGIPYNNVLPVSSTNMIWCSACHVTNVLN